MVKVRGKVVSAVREIIPSESFEIRSVKQIAKDVYLVRAEDEEYHYLVEVKLTPHGEEYHYKLLLFDYEEKG